MHLTFSTVVDPAEKGEICRSVLAKLPLWFGLPESNAEYEANASQYEMLKISEGDELVGFFSLKRNSERVTELYVLGIRPEFHRRGIGTEALKRIEREEKKRGVEYLEVKTLGPDRQSDEYRRTRLFYQKNGFIELDTLYHEWGEGIPCLIMIKKL